MSTQTKTQHTPGPWVATEPNRWGTVHIRSAEVPPQAIAEALQSDERYPSSANAALIAAAPELLACLEEAERMADYDIEQTGAVDRWRAVIAKARGEG